MKKFLCIIALAVATIVGAKSQVVNDTTTIMPQDDESMVMKVENWYANNMNYLSITISLGKGINDDSIVINNVILR